LGNRENAETDSLVYLVNSYFGHLATDSKLPEKDSHS
jgi:hypothetical protein